MKKIFGVTHSVTQSVNKIGELSLAERFLMLLFD